MAVAEPEDSEAALGEDSAGPAAYDQLSFGKRRMMVHRIDAAKKPETRRRRIEQAVDALRGASPA